MDPRWLLAGTHHHTQGCRGAGCRVQGCRGGGEEWRGEVASEGGVRCGGGGGGEGAGLSQLGGVAITADRGSELLEGLDYRL